MYVKPSCGSVGNVMPVCAYVKHSCGSLGNVMAVLNSCVKFHAKIFTHCWNINKSRREATFYVHPVEYSVVSVSSCEPSVICRSLTEIYGLCNVWYMQCYLFVVVTVRNVTAGGVQMSHCLQSQGLFFVCTVAMCYVDDLLFCWFYCLFEG